jgi:hypothetical protein
MLSWLKRRGSLNAGPDYRHVDSRGKAEDLWRRGELRKLLLLPVEFGGQDFPPNVVYVPPLVVELKTRIDLNTIISLAQKGQVSRYAATPEYEGKSFIPSLIRITATDPGRFEATVAIWGKAVQQSGKLIHEDAIVDPPAFAPESTTVEGLEPDEFVRAFITDYERWNQFAYQLSEKLPYTYLGDAAKTSAYLTTMGKFCPPGHKYQPIAFGSDSLHDNAREVVVGAERTADACVVKTRHTKVISNTTLVSDFEYHLRRTGERWFLTSLLYVNEKGKYECL